MGFPDRIPLLCLKDSLKKRVDAEAVWLMAGRLDVPHLGLWEWR